MLEVRLPLAMLRCALIPLVFPLALRDLRFRPNLTVGWRALGINPVSRTALLRALIVFHLGRFLNFWPDKLSLSRWQERICFAGLEAVRERVSRKQPTVLVCLHHGPIHVLRYVLRANGVPCAMLVLESRAERSPLLERKDRLSPPSDVPNVFCRDEIAEARRFLKDGGCLLLAIDYDRGKVCDVEFGPARIRIAKGAFRLASATGASVFPVVMTDSGPWQFKVNILGEIAAETESELLAQKAITLLAAPVMAVPEQMQTQLTDCLSVHRKM